MRSTKKQPKKSGAHGDDPTNPRYYLRVLRVMQPLIRKWARDQLRRTADDPEALVEMHRQVCYATLWIAAEVVHVTVMEFLCWEGRLTPEAAAQQARETTELEALWRRLHTVITTWFADHGCPLPRTTPEWEMPAPNRTM